jgi:hypothetical protein
VDYGLSAVTPGVALTWRVRAADFKDVTLDAFAVLVQGQAAWSADRIGAV